MQKATEMVIAKREFHIFNTGSGYTWSLRGQNSLRYVNFYAGQVGRSEFS